MISTTFVFILRMLDEYLIRYGKKTCFFGYGYTTLEKDKVCSRLLIVIVRNWTGQELYPLRNKAFAIMLGSNKCICLYIGNML